MSRAVLSQVDALVVLAVVFALAGREGPGVLLAAQSGCKNLTTLVGPRLRALAGRGLAASVGRGHGGGRRGVGYVVVAASVVLAGWPFATDAAHRWSS